MVHNAGRPQVAAAFLQHLGGGRVEVRWAGSMPADRINPTAVRAMLVLGTDIRDEGPKVLTADAVRAPDVVVTMGCGDVCPVFPGKSYEDWAAPADPPGRASRRCARSDQIRVRVLDGLGVEPVPVTG